MEKGNSASSLADFTFDEDTDFDFGSTNGEEGKSTSKTDPKVVIKAINKDDDDDDDFPTSTQTEADRKPKVAADKPKSTNKPVATATKDEDDEDDKLFDFDGKGVDLPKPKPKAVKTVEKEVEEEEPEEEPEEDKNEDKELEDLPEEFFSNLALDLQERGLLANYKAPKEGEELTEDGFFDAIEVEVEARVNETVDAFKETFDEEGKEYLKWKKNGGSTKDFITKYLIPTFSIKDFDEDNQSHIDRTIDHYLRTVEGLEEEEDIQERKKWLKDGGREKAYAKKYFDKINLADKGRQEKLQSQLEANIKQKKQDIIDSNAEIAESINSLASYGDIKFTDSDKKKLKSFMTKPTVKVGTNSYVPELQARLRKILAPTTKADMNRLIALAAMVEADFKVPNLEKQVETRKTREIKTRVRANSPRGSTGSPSASSSLVDLINE